MKIQPILDRLASLDFATRGGALEYAALTQLPGRLDALYVIPQALQAQPSTRGTVAVDQKVTATFAAVMVIGVGRSTPAKISERVDELEAAVIDRLVGWQHPDASGPCELVDGATLAVDGAAFTWALRFRCSYHIRKVQ